MKAGKRIDVGHPVASPGIMPLWNMDADGGNILNPGLAPSIHPFLDQKSLLSFSHYGHPAGGNDSSRWDAPVEHEAVNINLTQSTKTE